MDIIRYGSVTTKINHVDYKQTHTTTNYTERHPIKNYQDALALILKHIERAETGEIHNIGMVVVEKDTLPRFIDLSWSINSTLQTPS